MSAYRLDIFWLAAKAANVPEHIYRGNLAPGKRGLLARPRDQVHSPLSLSLGKRDSPKKKKKKKSSQGEVIQVNNSECLKMVGRPLQCQHVKVLDKETHVWKQASLFERAIMV